MIIGCFYNGRLVGFVKGIQKSRRKYTLTQIPSEAKKYTEATVEEAVETLKFLASDTDRQFLDGSASYLVSLSK